MFHRRRATSNPASRAPPSSAALLAAGKVFPHQREPHGGLSSAAAAAALRTHTTSPTPVGETVTKRMARRGSTSSHGSGSVQPPGLLRRTSSGSMTERSFRAPSPNRGSPLGQVDHNAPPVPAVPKEVPSTGVVHRRASSLEPAYRGGSPVGRGSGRGVSLDRGGYAPNSGRGQGIRVNTLSQVPEAELQDGSPRNVNFSRPMSPQAQTPSPSAKPAASARGGHSGWFAGPVVNSEATFRGAKTRPKTADGVSAYQLHNAQQAVQNAADKPVSKRSSAYGVEGSRLATGSMRAKPSGTSVPSFQPPARRSTPQPVDPKSPYAVYDPSTRTFVHKQEAMERFRALDDNEGASTQHYVQQHAQPPPRQPRVQERQPSPVRYVPVAPPSPSPPPPQREESPIRYERQASPIEMPAEERASVGPATRSPDSAVLARRNSEDYAEADFHPPRELEAPSAVEPTHSEYVHEEQPNSPLSPKVASSQDGPYPRIASTPPPVQPATSVLAGRGRGSVRDRNSSLSPGRNAHFAAVAVEFPNGFKHQPPPRSVSPAKSALKASPSVSRRNSSPLAGEGRTTVRAAPSEASDTVSDDGFRKKKKQVRVSFEEEPIIAGSSAYPEVQTPTSPTGLSASRWSSAKEGQSLDDVMKPTPVLPSFGSIRDRNRRQDERDMPEKVTETVSSSLSTSVGSIGEPVEASSDHAVGGILAHDFASKSILKPSSNEPLPPEVTTVEGSGYASDSEQSDIFQEEPTRKSGYATEVKKEMKPSIPEPEPKTLTTPHESKLEVPEVPMIAIQPASPSPTEKPAPKFPRFVPGGWDYDDESDPEVKESTEQPAETKTPLPTFKAAPTASAVPQIAPLTSANLPQDDSASDDNSSIYSDAYEEITDDEAGGFGSIDAMVESPAATSAASGLMFSKYADTAPVEPPRSNLRQERVSEATPKQESQAPSQDWDEARQHWKGLSSSRQIQPEESTPPTHAVTTKARVQPVTKANSETVKAEQPKPAPERKARVAVTSPSPGSIPKKSPKRDGVQSGAQVLRQPQQPAQQSPAQPRKSAMKKTTVTPAAVLPPAAQPQMRKTMRGDGARPSPAMQAAPETHMRQSMRGSPPTGASRGPSGLAASRHSMPPADTRPQKGALQKRHIPATAVPQPRPQSASGPLTKRAAAPKPIVPAPTYDDDSDASASSFRRERPRSSSRGDNGRYTMRGSMRGGPAPTMRTTPAVRPMSPPQQPSSPPPTLRKSLRPSSPTPEHTTAIPAGAKPSRFSIRSLSPAGRFRGSKTTPDDAPPLPLTASPKQKTPMFGKPAKVKAIAPAPKSRFKSRIAPDSDDSDDERPTRFQSRFADSDDSDEELELPQGLTPVRGIPRKPGEEDGDSTDLEEEASDGESPAKLAAKDVEKGGGSLTNGNGASQGASLAAGSLRDSKHAPLPTFEVEGSKKSKKRGFFGLGKKKESAPASTEAAVEPQRVTPSDIPLPPQHTDRTQRPLSAIDEDKEMEQPVSPGRRTPKLQRRSTPEWGRSTSDSWPLPQPPTIGDEPARPQSSDGIIPRRTSLRPTLQKRNSAMSEARTAIDPKTGKEVVIGRSGKKKKFQGLRRVFGLND